MEDREILDLYLARSEDAVLKTAEKYGRVCHYIAYQILFDDADASEIVNDTYLKVWKSIPPASPVSLRSFLAMIAGRLARDRYREKQAKKRGGGQIPLLFDELTECIPDAESASSLCDRIALRDALNRFLRTLPETERNIFLRRYWYCTPVAEIARDFSMKKSHVTVLMHRTRAKLKQFLEKEGFTV
jgi:RNA polymerase sigma-70 factor (ECF subfamily)